MALVSSRFERLLNRRAKLPFKEGQTKHVESYAVPLCILFPVGEIHAEERFAVPGSMPKPGLWSVSLEHCGSIIPCVSQFVGFLFLVTTLSWPHVSIACGCIWHTGS